MTPGLGYGGNADGLAGGPYFESKDGGFFYLDSNSPVTMTVVSTGYLTGVNTSAEIPTWYTLAASGPFSIGGNQLNDGNIPGDGIGSYAADTDTNGTMELGSTPFHPNQWPFDMKTLTNETITMSPSVQGNMNFHARIKRNGILDPR